MKLAFIVYSRRKENLQRRERNLSISRLHGRTVATCSYPTVILCKR
jgi:hypothetical protein